MPNICVQPYSDKTIPYSPETNPYQKNTGSYSKLTNPYTKSDTYLGKLCINIIYLAHQDNSVVLAQDGSAIILNI
jgi:hypothetical protein